MAAIDLTSGTAGAYGSGELQLQGKVQMTSTLTPVTDNLNVASPLLLSTTLVQTTSTLKITTNDNPYIDAEDGAGNNRFTVGRDTGSQQVNVDFASNPGGSTTIVGAIRTYVDGVNLSEVMAFREDGNVGIGTTSPGAKLDIHSASNVITQFNRTGAGKSWIQFQQAGTARWNTGYDNTNGNYTIYDAVNAADRMVVTNAGNVGIGTSAPNAPLEVQADSGGTSIRVKGRSAANSGTIRFFDNASSTQLAKIESSDNSFEIGSINNVYASFLTNGTERMRIDSSGNVAIGTTSPADRLTVVTAPGAQNRGITVYDYTGAGGYGGALTLGIEGLSYQNLGKINTFLTNGGPGTVAGDMVFSTTVSATLAEKMRITSAGNVGIGTSTPDNTLDLGTSTQGRGLTFDNYSNLFSTYSAGDLVLSNNFYGNTSSDTYLTSTTATFGAAGIRVSATSGTALGGQIQFFANTATSKTAGTAFTPTEICRVTPNGLTFNGDTAAANALDDYEEGTWTMGVAFGGASVGQTTTSNTGTYTKIGRQVTVNGYLALSNKGSSTGDAQLTGLPFTIPNVNQSFATASLWFASVTFSNQFQGYGLIGSTTVNLREITILGVDSALTDADFANNSQIIVSLTYFV